MSELNREHIIKAFECCIKAETWGDCEDLGCPARRKQGCHFYLRTDDDQEKTLYIEMLKDALALIKELTEDLHASRTELTRVQGDTINKFADRLKKYYSNLKDTTLSSMVAYHIDQIANEVLGENK